MIICTYAMIKQQSYKSSIPIMGASDQKATSIPSRACYGHSGGLPSTIWYGEAHKDEGGTSNENRGRAIDCYSPKQERDNICQQPN